MADNIGNNLTDSERKNPSLVYKALVALQGVNLEMDDKNSCSRRLGRLGMKRGASDSSILTKRYFIKMLPRSACLLARSAAPIRAQVEFAAKTTFI